MDTNLTTDEKQRIKACLLDFVERVSKGDRAGCIGKGGEKVLGEESQVLPEVVKVLLHAF